MIVSTNWLGKWVDFNLSNAELSGRLTMAGLEVGTVTSVTDCDDRVVVGSVHAIRPHPTRNHLAVCMVDAGGDREIQVVCGAPVVKEGAKYPIAPVGSKVGEIVIDSRSIHGETSSGMLCSAGELGLGTMFDTLMELDSTAPVGCSLNRYLNLPDTIMDIELTPNRADCLSIRGVAREVAIIANQQLESTPVQSVAAQTSTSIPVTVLDPEDCPNYCGRVIENINSEARTPDWMATRLERIGLRCIHPIVDITNYVMMELGQPMHAFDTDIFDSSGIIVRRSKAGERLTLLDGDEIDLGDGILLIADRDGPNGLAGVMGGESSGIRPETRNVFLEAAFFSPLAVRRSVSRFGKHTDASHRFERGVHPLQQAEAMQRATQLILEVTGGVAGPLQEVTSKQYVPKKQSCTVRKSRIERILGVTIPEERIESILRSVNDRVTTLDNSWEVVPPDYRFDLELEHDQIEEVARIYGYDQIPSTMHVGIHTSGSVRETTITEQSIRETMHGQGYFEAITYSFVDPDLQGKFKPEYRAKLLANPLSENMSAMRTSLWPGLLGAFLENYRRNKDRIRLYEVGRVFLPDQEVDMIGGLCYGMANPQQWGLDERMIDFFDIKGDLFSILDLTGKTDQFEIRAQPNEGLHPGCSASIYHNQRKCGSIGQIHPDIFNEINEEDKVFVFELELDVIGHRRLNQYSSISRFPPLVRDISIVVGADIPVADISDEIDRCDQPYLENITLFDVYCGQGIDTNSKSVAYRLTFRSHEQTLTDNEVNASLKSILSTLNAKFGAQLREQAE
ncbi:MAG: phenylalanine--tRNA ligase subunit beta [Acidiferrobacterales bacterium]|nr:phenylalanine--tRNA ligase subunit beta [Acidiferrobacterales bacterium]